MKNIVFRVDASIQIGSGHVMRCLTLADMLAKAGVFCYFICRQHEGNMLNLIKTKGYPVLPLAKANELKPDCLNKFEYAGWLGVDINIDVQETLSALKVINKPVIDWVVVDHYAIGSEWEKQISSYCNRIMVIDDLANRNHYCDILLDQNPLVYIHEKYNALCLKETLMLLGPKYTLLSPDFLEAHLNRIKFLQNSISSENGEIIIFMGASDQEGLTLKVLESLENEGYTERLHVLAGLINNNKHSISQYCQARNIKCTINHENTAKLLVKAAMGIVACGKFAIELQALGIPCLLVPLSEIQEQVAMYFANYGNAKVVKKNSLLNNELFLALEIKLFVQEKLTAKVKNPVISLEGTNSVIKEMVKYNYG